jgi:hypothetical protein
MAHEMTLADHAEAWHREQGKKVPPRDSAKWQQMYERWATWAFADLRGPEKPRPRKPRRNRK